MCGAGNKLCWARVVRFRVWVRARFGLRLRVRVWVRVRVRFRVMVG